MSVVPVSVFLCRRMWQEKEKMYRCNPQNQFEQFHYYYGTAQAYEELYKFFASMEKDELIDQDDTYINWNVVHGRI